MDISSKKKQITPKMLMSSESYCRDLNGIDKTKFDMKEASRPQGLGKKQKFYLLTIADDDSQVLQRLSDQEIAPINFNFIKKMKDGTNNDFPQNCRFGTRNLITEEGFYRCVTLEETLFSLNHDNMDIIEPQDLDGLENQVKENQAFAFRLFQFQFHDGQSYRVITLEDQ